MESNVYNKNNIYVYSDEIVKRFYNVLFWYFYQKQVLKDCLERFQWSVLHLPYLYYYTQIVKSQ